MKMTLVQQMMDYQDRHDLVNHPDIYNQGVNFKLKHFALHLSKYFARLILVDRPLNDIFVDTLLITLSLTNTLNARVDEFSYEGSNSNISVQREFAKVIEDLSKSLDSIDHIEVHNSREVLNCIPDRLLKIIQQYIYNYQILDFETLVNQRYFYIRTQRLS